MLHQVAVFGKFSAKKLNDNFAFFPEALPQAEVCQAYSLKKCFVFAIFICPIKKHPK